MEGEYGQSGRFEFPNSNYLFRVLEAMPLNEQKQHSFYSFNNVLVAARYTEDTKKFVWEVARKIGIEMEFLKLVE